MRDEATTELARILALPRRPVLDCARDPVTRRYAPEAEALAVEVTARYARPRITCGCLPRRIHRAGGDAVVIYGSPPRPGAPPPIPIETTAGALLADSAHDRATCRAVEDLRRGGTVDLPGLGRCINSLKPEQAWFLDELSKVLGILGFLPIGSGKTVSVVLAALAVPGVKTAVILAKPDQRLHYRDHYLHLREHFRVPGIVFDRSEILGSQIVPGAPVVHFVHYSLLQNEKSTTLLESVAPDMVIADEAHCLAAAPGASRQGSTRAGRFLRYAGARNNEGRPIIFACTSGSLINRTFLDVTHLAAFALGMGSPYPIAPRVWEAWSQVIDPVRSPDRKSDVAAALVSSFGSSPDPRLFAIGALGDGGVREGIRERAVVTPGVVSSRASAVMVSITLSERKAPPIPKVVRDALIGVRDNGLLPNGDIGDVIIDEDDRTEVGREIAAGFYNYWRFPSIPCDRGAAGCREPPLCPGCQLIKDWYDARKPFYRELRLKLRLVEPHLDSPSLCMNAAERAYREPRYEGNLPVWPAASWPAWAAIKDRVPHVSAYKWIGADLPEAKDPATHPGYYLARDAAAWARESPGVVWYENRAFGECVARLSGCNLHAGGADAEARIRAEDGKKSIIVSISAHSESRDGLQRKFSRQLVTQPMSSGKAWDQLLGRLARDGQTADTIVTEVYRHVPEYRDALRKAKTLAEFDRGMMPTESLFLSADTDFEF